VEKGGGHVKGMWGERGWKVKRAKSSFGTWAKKNQKGSCLKGAGKWGGKEIKTRKHVADWEG